MEEIDLFQIIYSADYSSHVFGDFLSQDKLELMQ